MRAIRVHEWGRPPQVDELAIPEPGPGETLVRIEAAAVAHLDRTVAGGDFGIKPRLPYVGGVEGCGVVVASDQLAPGTRVMLRGGGLGLSRDGTWAEWTVVTTKHLTVIPEGMTAEVGASYFVPVATAAVALERVGRLGEWMPDAGRGDEVVVVAGAAGAVGAMVAQLALRAGARVLGTVVSNEQADSLPEGVEPILADDAERHAQLAELRPATLLVDTIGGAGLGQRCGWVRPGGRAVSIGYVAGTSVALDLPNWLLQDVSLLPVNMIRRDREARDIAAELAPLLVSGELRIEVESFAFADAAKALEGLAAGTLRGRAVLVPEGVDER